MFFVAVGTLRLFAPFSAPFDGASSSARAIWGAQQGKVSRDFASGWVCSFGSGDSVGVAVRDAALEFGLRDELLMAVIHVESRCNASARSPRGAMGLMQLMPATARQMGVLNPYSVRENVFGGARYLSLMLEEFDGNIDLALAAYNAGPGSVRTYTGIPPYRETRRYVKHVRGLYDQLLSLGNA